MAIESLAEEYHGLPVVEYDPVTGVADPTAQVYRVRSEEGMPESAALLEAFLADPRVREIPALVLGYWDRRLGPADILLGPLVGARDKLPSLRALFLGDITEAEQEMAWIRQDDLSPIFPAFPLLEEFRTRGGDGLGFPGLRHANLKRLIVETAGLPREVMGQVRAASLPALERLSLWLGTPLYTEDGTLDDLAPLLSGTLFPRLTHLGLCNCAYADDLAEAVVRAPVVRQLEVLDLSLGNLGNAGARALLNLPTDARLRTLDFRHHYVSADLLAQLRQLPFEVIAGEAEEDTGDVSPLDRFVAHTE